MTDYVVNLSIRLLRTHSRVSGEWREPYIRIVSQPTHELRAAHGTREQNAIREQLA